MSKVKRLINLILYCFLRSNRLVGPAPGFGLLTAGYNPNTFIKNKLKHKAKVATKKNKMEPAVKQDNSAKIQAM